MRYRTRLCYMVLEIPNWGKMQSHLGKCCTSFNSQEQYTKYSNGNKPSWRAIPWILFHNLALIWTGWQITSGSASFTFLGLRQRQSGEDIRSESQCRATTPPFWPPPSQTHKHSYCTHSYVLSVWQKLSQPSQTLTTCANMTLMRVFEG